MMYIDLYDNIKNPLDEKDILDTLAEVYARRYSSLGGFYSSLVKNTAKDYLGKYNPEESDRFYATAFNKWKKGIVSLTKEEFAALKYRGSYDDRLIKLRDYLKNIPDVKTKEEASKITCQHFEDEELDSAMEDYCWDSTSWGTGWTHVKSRYLNGKRGNDFSISHRLYLNIEPIDIHSVANKIMKKCDERNIPYYFKFDEYGDRDDTLVIYSNTERLPLYIDILEEIAKENPEIKQRSKHPPILTGKINEWIGYGAEPEMKNGKKRSFNSVRSNCIEKAIEKEFEEWLSVNKNLKINYQGKEISLIDYIAKLATKNKIEMMKIKLSRKPESKSQEEYERYLGYDNNDLENPSLFQNMEIKIKDGIKKYFENPEDKPVDIEIKNSEKTIKILGYKIRYMKDLLVPYVMKNDLNFRNKVRNRIQLLSEKEDIDLEKYCFDKTTRQKFLDQDQENQQIDSLYQSAQNYAIKHCISAPRIQQPNESNIDYLNYLSKYAKEKVVKKDKNKIQNNTTVQNSSTYRLTKDQIIQDLPICSMKASRYQGIMSDEDIKASQKKIGTYKPVKKGK